MVGYYGRRILWSKDIMVVSKAKDISSRVKIVLWVLLSMDSKFDVIKLSVVSMVFCGK